MLRLKKSAIFIVALGGLQFCNGLAIDFKIDLPPNAGRTGEVSKKNKMPVVEKLKEIDDANEVDPWLKQEQDQKNIEENINAADLDLGSKNIPLQDAIPQMPEELNSQSNLPNDLSIQSPLTQKSALSTLGGAFPTPQCLKQNVTFWERIYRETELNNGLIHDREDLGIVYGNVRLPANGAARAEAMRAFKAYYQEQLNEMASTPKNQWGRDAKEIARVFAPKDLTPERLRRAADNLRIQTGLRERFEAGVQRSINYLPTVHRIVLQQNLPADIVNLPHVESSYTPHAYSKVGASGLWQIMPNTMRALLGPSAVRRRNEIDLSTLAAAKLLRQNFQATQSWPLALTAYNHGLNGVLRAVKQTGSRDLCEIIEKYNSKSFRFASSNFYAQFLAARNVAMERYTQLSKNRGPARILRPVLASINKGRT